MGQYWDTWLPERGDMLSSSYQRHARSALFIDPMLLRDVSRAGVIIIAAIPVTTGDAGCWGTTLTR
jgi:hypothetical protein